MGPSRVSSGSPVEGPARARGHPRRSAGDIPRRLAPGDWRGGGMDTTSQGTPPAS